MSIMPKNQPNNNQKFFIREALEYLADEALRRRDIKTAVIIEHAVEQLNDEDYDLSNKNFSAEELEATIIFLGGFFSLNKKEKEELINKLSLD